MPIRYLLCLITFHFSLTLLPAQKAEPIKRMTQVQQSGTYYAGQSTAWKKIVQSEPKNAHAWFEYYTASRYSNIFNGGSNIDLTKIVEHAVKEIPNSFEANYLTFALAPWDPASFKYLEKAYGLDPNNAQTYQAFINHYLVTDEKNKFKEFCIKHYNSDHHSPGYMNWNYNVLVNLEPNAILITEGDNDTYPAWTLQEVKEFRTDVAIININLLINDEYRGMIFRQLGLGKMKKSLADLGIKEYKTSLIRHILNGAKRPTYLSIGVPETTRAAFEENLHIVGLSFKIDKSNFDNMAILRKSYEDLFHLDYLNMTMQADPSQAALDKYSRSYLPSMFKLYKDYQDSGANSKATNLEALIMIVGEKSNTLDETIKTLAKYN